MMRIAVPTTKENKNESGKVATTFSRAQLFSIYTIDDFKIKNVTYIENIASTLNHGAGPIAAKSIIDQDIDLILSGDIGPGARDILETYEIKVFPTQKGKKVNDIIMDWILGQNKRH
jgi:predicted Fe-Mo cluster-binding NifX family protein